MSSLSIAGCRTKIGKNVTYNLGDGLTSIHYGVISCFNTTNGDCGRAMEVLTGRLSGRVVGNSRGRECRTTKENIAM